MRLPVLTEIQKKQQIEKVVSHSNAVLFGLVMELLSKAKNLEPVSRNSDTQNELIQANEKFQNDFRRFLDLEIEKIKKAPLKPKNGKKSRKMLMQSTIQSVSISGDIKFENSVRFPSKAFRSSILPKAFVAHFMNRKYPKGYHHSNNAGFRNLYMYFDKNKARNYKENEKITARCLVLTTQASDLLHIAVKKLIDNGLIDRKNGQVLTVRSSGRPTSTDLGIGTAPSHIFLAGGVRAGVPFYFDPTMVGKGHPSLGAWQNLIKEKFIPPAAKPRSLPLGIGSAILIKVANTLMMDILQGRTIKPKEIQKVIKVIEEKYKSAISLDPGSHFAHMNYGSVLLKSGRYKEAISSYQTSLRLNPYDYMIPKLGIAQIKMNQGKLDEALKLAKSLLKKINIDLVKASRGEPVTTDISLLKQTQEALHVLIAQVLIEAKKYKKASRFLRPRINSKNIKAKALYGQALIGSSKKNCPKGLKLLKSVNKQTGNTVQSYLSILANAYKRCGKNEKAQEIYGQISSNSVSTELQKADSFFGQHKYLQALKYYQNYLQKNQTDSVAYFNLAACYENVKQYLSALRFYEKSNKIKRNGQTIDRIKDIKDQIAFKYGEEFIQIYNSNLAKPNPSIIPQLERLLAKAKHFFNSKSSESQKMVKNLERVLRIAKKYHK